MAEKPPYLDLVKAVDRHVSIPIKQNSKLTGLVSHTWTFLRLRIKLKNMMHSTNYSFPVILDLTGTYIRRW